MVCSSEAIGFVSALKGEEIDLQLTQHGDAYNLHFFEGLDYHTRLLLYRLSSGDPVEVCGPYIRPCGDNGVGGAVRPAHQPGVRLPTRLHSLRLEPSVVSHSLENLLPSSHFRTPSPFPGP